MKIRLPLPLLIALTSIAPSFSLQAETISTWDQLKTAITSSSQDNVLGNDLSINAMTGQIEISKDSSFTLDGGGFSIIGAISPGDKQTTFNNAGEFTLSSITFSNNSTQASVSLPHQNTEANSYGGAIHNTGKLSISSNSVFTGNMAASNGTTSVADHNKIIDVTANSYGGAIYNANTVETQTIANTTFSHNTASSTTTGTDLNPGNALYYYGRKPVLAANAYGGAVYNSGSMDFNNTVFEGNSADAKSNYIYSLAQGGAIYNTATSGLTKITNGAFTNNFASSHVDSYGFSSSWIDRVPEAYRPHAQGGAIYQAGGDLEILHTDFSGNYVVTNAEYAHARGGAIYNLNASALFQGVTFLGNYAQGTCPTQSYVSAGAIFNGGNNVMTIVDNLFVNNYATAPGNMVGAGAISNAGGLSITDSAFEGNYATATSEQGAISAHSGAIYNISASQEHISIHATSFSGNYAIANINNTSSSANAGALSNAGTARTSISMSTFDGNYATANKLAFGGAINNSTSATLEITNSIIENNYAAASTSNSASKAQGGALYNTGKSIFVSTNFSNNRAEAGGDALGGAIYHEGTSLGISGGTFDNNKAASTIGNATGGAIYYTLPLTSITPSPATISSNATFTNNSATGANSATGGAIHMGNRLDSNSKLQLLISDTSFTTNHATAGTYAAGGAINVLAGQLSLNNVKFTGNYVSSSGNSVTADLHGGAIYNSGDLTIIDSTFENNYTMAGQNSLGGAIFSNGQSINIVAAGQDTIFRGNRQGVTSLDGEGKPIDGQSNAIYVRQGELNLHTSNNASVIFYDSLAAERAGCIHINSNSPLGYPNSGTAYFKDDVKIENFEVNLNAGTMSMGNNTFIKGNVSASSGTTFLIAGFTKLEGNYTIVKTDERAQTVYIDLDDNMITNYSEEKPIWDFNQGQSSLINPGGTTLNFILDITDIQNFPEHFRPYIFSHFGQTEELMENVRNSANVVLIGDDGWTYRIPEIYTEGNRTLDYFDFLSGQYGELDPFDPNNPNWVAPIGVGSAQVETLWTTTRSLWSFADGARTQNKARLKHNQNTAIWISGIGNYYTQENQRHIQGYRYRSWGTSIGGEYTFSPEWTAGAAIGEIWGKHDINYRMGSIDKNATLALLYLNRDIKLDKTNSLSFNLQGGYETSRNKGSVKVNSFINDSLYGKWKDQAWMIDLRATWTRILNEKTWLDTFAGLQYTYAEQGDSSITGDKYRFNLSDGNMYDFRAMLGTGIRHAHQINNHATLSYVRAGIIQDIQRDVPHINVNGQKRNWTAVGSKPGRTAFNFNVGSSVQIINNWSLGIDYTLEAANKSLMQTGRVSVMCEF